MKTCKLLFFLLLFCLPLKLLAANLSVEIIGDFLLRVPGSSSYIKSELKSFPEDSIFSIPDLENASSSTLIIDGQNIKLFPGTVFKVTKDYLLPLAGRFEFNNEDSEANTINVVANNCNAGYVYGHFLIEVTPDNGVFFALKNKGNAWVKDISRKVYVLKQGQQLQVPLFGNTVLKRSVDYFWGKAPSSFKHLGEVGQETAYGILGNNSSFINSLKSSLEETKEKKEKKGKEDKKENLSEFSKTNKNVDDEEEENLDDEDFDEDLDEDLEENLEEDINDNDNDNNNDVKQNDDKQNDDKQNDDSNKIIDTTQQ